MTFGSQPNGSYANQIQLDLRIAMLACPQIQGRGVNFIYHGRSEANASEIDSFEVMLTVVTGFNPHVIELRRMKVSQFCRSLFAATRADHAPKLPGRKTTGANQITVAALSGGLFVLKKTNLRVATAERAETFAHGNLSACGSDV